MIDFSSIKAIFFDADDTLFEVKGSVGQQYAPHLKNHGYDILADSIDRVIPEAWLQTIDSYENRESEYTANHTQDRREWREFLYNVMSALEIYQPSEQLLEDIYDTFAEAHSRQLLPYIKQTLTALRRHPITLGVLTNNDNRIHRLIPALGLGDYFHHIFCASDLGYRKPSHRVFSRIAEHLQLLPQEILYIGDCPRNDVAGALNAQWNALWLKRGASQLRRDTPLNSAQSVPHISCYSELLRHL